MMILAGILVTFLGFLIAVSSLGMSSSTGGRLALVLLGITVSLVGIIGVLKRAYLKNVLWKK